MTYRAPTKYWGYTLDEAGLILTEHRRANEPTEDKPKTWGEMTDAEKGALLLDFHKGWVIEVYNGGNERWYDTRPDGPAWDGRGAYRRRIEPVHETEVLKMHYLGGARPFVDETMSSPTHRIQFETIDGKPDCNSIVMEAIGDD